MHRFWIAAFATFALDQASKLGVVFGLDLLNRGEIDVLPPYLVFRMAWNEGINFGLLSHGSDVARWGLIALALVISGWVVWWMRRERGNLWALMSGGVLVGGAIGNVVDRIAYGAVADFLNMSCCGIENPYAFNVADIAIFLGAVGLVLFSKGDGKASGTGGKPARAKRRTP
jgi:signal peptidase II